MNKVLVAGATGYLGRYAARAFKMHGYWVRVLVRSPRKVEEPGRFLEPAVASHVDDTFVGDVTKPESLRGCADGVDVVFSSIGMTRPQKGYSFQDIDYRGNLALLEEVKSSSARKFVYVSVFDGPRYEHLAIIKAHEDFVRALRASSIPSTVVRPTGYFSDMGEYFNMARRGRVFLIGPGMNRMNPIHGADLAEVCVDAAETGEPELPAGGPDVLSQNQIARLAFEALRRAPKITHVPVVVARGAAAAVRPFNRTIADLVSFFATAGTEESIAPMCGTHTLAEYRAQLAAHARCS